MTLVIKIATLLIVEKLDKQIFDSREKDNKSGFLTYISAPRDRALSAKKRDILEHLMSEITTIQEHTGLDEKAKIIAIITALQTAKQITLSESSKVNQSRGSTERLLDHLFSFTQEFYNLAGAFKFQNKLITDDSYTLFVEACGFYFARRILDKCHTTLFKDVMENRYITPHNEFYQHLDLLVNERMYFAWQTMLALKPKDSNLEEIQTAIGINSIDLLLLQHKSLREKYNLTMGQFYLQNYLDEYLIKARQNRSYQPNRFGSPLLDQDLSATLLTHPEKSGTSTEQSNMRL
jgi:hypothetical protein